MKTLEIKIIEKLQPSQWNYGGWEVELQCGQNVIEAHINENNLVTPKKLGSVFLSLFQKQPFTSEKIKEVDSAIQEAFRNWDKENTSINVNI